MLTNNRSFEIFYGSGGHCGPYSTLFQAVRDAVRKLRGRRLERTTVVRDRAIADPKQATLIAIEKQEDGSIVMADKFCRVRHLLHQRKDTNGNTLLLTSPRRN